MEMKSVPFVARFAIIAYIYLRSMLATLLATWATWMASRFALASVMEYINSNKVRTQ